MVNYVNITKGFMCLLKKDTLFIWDERAHESFDALNKALVSTPLLKPLEYSRDYLHYIATYKGTVVYYLSRNLVGPELKYSHVEKLALASVHAVERLRHYILLCKTTVVRRLQQRRRYQSFLQSIEGFLGSLIPDKRGVLLQKTHETFSDGGIVHYKTTKKVIFPL